MTVNRYDDVQLCDRKRNNKLQLPSTLNKNKLCRRVSVLNTADRKMMENNESLTLKKIHFMACLVMSKTELNVIISVKHYIHME